LPSTNPRSRRPSRNAWCQSAASEGENGERSPIRGTLASACARTAPAQASTPAPSAMINSRRVVMRPDRLTRSPVDTDDSSILVAFQEAEMRGTTLQRCAIFTPGPCPKPRSRPVSRSDLKYTPSPRGSGERCAETWSRGPVFGDATVEAHVSTRAIAALHPAAGSHPSKIRLESCSALRGRGVRGKETIDLHTKKESRAQPPHPTPLPQPGERE